MSPLGYLIPCFNKYNLLPASHPNNITHGELGLFHKDTLPLKLCKDVSFDESTVVKLKFGCKKISLTLLYRTPSVKHDNPGFTVFLNNFKSLHSNI